ncbi:MAG TPA: hypothetical protein VNQ76_19215 [Planctomicrobium sp.]|nr:hypothetical protein [Planctomicrobium sp.]
MTNGSQRIRTLYGLLRGGNEQPEVMNAILRLVEEDRDARRTYIQLVHMEVNLPWLVDAGTETETRILRQVQKEVASQRRLWFWTISSSLIAVMLFVGIGLLRTDLLDGNELVVPQMLAYVNPDPDAVVDGVVLGQRSVVVREGKPFTLLHGTVQLVTDGQSTIILTAPLQMEMVERKILKLIQGDLVASVSKNDVGFVVETPGSKYVDLGTKFGISVDLAGNSQLHVFDGIVAAEPIADTAGQPRRLVRTGESLAYTPTGLLEAERLSKPTRFMAGLNRLHGIRELTRAIHHLPAPPKSVQPGMLIHNKFIYLIPEQRHVRLPQELEVVSPLSGRITRKEDCITLMLPPETHCSSYLIHLQTRDTNTPLSGTIRFDQPILGLVLSTEGLFETDTLFGLEQMAYPDWDTVVSQKLSRGSVIGFRGTSDSGDIVEVLDDRHTLSLKIRGGGANFDQIRILVSDPYSPLGN